MLKKLPPSAEDTATQWVRVFGLALASSNDKALAELLLPDSHWRNLFRNAGSTAATPRCRSRPSKRESL
jgi:hypothetical protein